MRVLTLVLVLALLGTACTPMVHRGKVVTAVEHYVGNLKVPNAKEAERLAIASLKRSPDAAASLYATVLTLTKAHRSIDGINAREWVWLVLVQNAAANDSYPVPDAIVWVRASDGLVVNL